MTTIVFNEQIAFPAKEQDVLKLKNLKEKIAEFLTLEEDWEYIELMFNLEFASKNGNYITDFYEWSETGNSIQATVSDEVLLEHSVPDFTFVPRFSKEEGAFEYNRNYTFSIIHDQDTDIVEFKIDSITRVKRFRSSDFSLASLL
jgi:hypothetical protein